MRADKDLRWASARWRSVLGFLLRTSERLEESRIDRLDPQIAVEHAPSRPAAKTPKAPASSRSMLPPSMILPIMAAYRFRTQTKTLAVMLSSTQAVS
jgi:hypothetical protein